ncbi:MAG: FAD-dependent oxidoreductase [Deinococcales bacterium]
MTVSQVIATVQVITSFKVVLTEAITLLPFLRNLRVLRQWTGICDMSPDYSPSWARHLSKTFFITTGWGTWGFKAIPASGEQMAEYIARDKAPKLIAPFSLDRFAQDLHASR